MSQTCSSAATAVPERLRPLKWNELVRSGDFVQAEDKGFEPWSGHGGFRADAFVKQIYRRTRSIATRLKS